MGICVGIMIVYWVGMNAFLRTRWFRDAINFSPEQFRVEYAGAYSVLPGDVHVEGLSIRGSDGAVQWILKLDRCDFHVHFLDLLHRRFHAGRVRGSGLSMRLRLRQQEFTPDVLADLPPVPGFPDPPYFEIGPPTAPLTDAEYKLWSVQLDDVDAQHVREIWIQTLRYAGDVRVRGRWLFRPVRWLDVGPATIDVGALEVTSGPTRSLFGGLRGTVDATVHPFDVRKPKGWEILKYVSVKAELSGVAKTAAVIDALAPGASWTLAPEEDPLDVVLVVDHGALRPGSRLSISSKESEARGAGLSTHAGVSAELRVETESEQTVARLDVGVSRARVTRDDVELARAASASIHFSSRDVDLAAPSLDSAAYTLDLQEAEARSMAFLRPVLPDGVTVDSGSLRADGSFEGRVADESARGQLGFTLRDLSVSSGTSRFGANARGTLKLESSSARDGDIDLTDSRIALEDVVATVGDVEVHAPTLGLRAIRAVVERGMSPDVDVDVDLPRAELIHPRAALGPHDAISVSAGRASVATHLDVDVSSRSATGTASLVAHALRVHVGSDTYQGELDVALKARSLGADRRTTLLSGSTASFTSGGAPSTDEWWARVSLGETALRLGEAPSFRAAIHLAAENASPAQALLAKLTPLPRLVLDAFRMDDLHANGEIRETPSSFEARSILAEGSGNRVQLEYAKHDADQQSVALLHAGGLRVGVTLAGAGTPFQLFGREEDAEAWFSHQAAALRVRAHD